MVIELPNSKNMKSLDAIKFRYQQTHLEASNDNLTSQYFSYHPQILNSSAVHAHNGNVPPNSPMVGGKNTEKQSFVIYYKNLAYNTNENKEPNALKKFVDNIFKKGNHNQMTIGILRKSNKSKKSKKYIIKKLKNGHVSAMPKN